MVVAGSGVSVSAAEKRPGRPGFGHGIVDDSLIELLLADRINLMDALAHARDPNFVKEEFQKALKSQRKGWFAGMFKK